MCSIFSFKFIKNVILHHPQFVSLTTYILYIDMMHFTIGAQNFVYITETIM